MLEVSFALIFFVCCVIFFFSPAGTGHRIRPAILSLPLVWSRQVVSHSVLAAPGHLDSYSPRTDPASYTNKHCRDAVLPCCVEGKTLRRAVLTALRPPKSPNKTVKSRRPTSCKKTTTFWRVRGKQQCPQFHFVALFAPK